MSDWLMNVGGLLSGIGSGASAVFNALSQDKANRQNLRLQEKTWRREDSAVQRRAADLKAAGINPLLAAGQAAVSGPAVRVEAPRVERQAVSGLGDALMDLVRGNVQIAQTQAQTELVKAQAQNAGTSGALLEIQKSVAEATAQADIDRSRSLAESAGYKAKLDKFESFIETAINGGSAILEKLPGGPSPVSRSQFGDSLMYAKKLVEANSNLNKLEQNLIALSSAGMLNKVTEEFVSTHPGYAQGVNEYLKVLGLGVQIAK